MLTSSRALGSSLLIAALAIAVSCGGSPPSGPPDVLLITIDTLRADHLSSYGYRLETSPRIDALAARGVRFEDCTVQWPVTWPSMASLLTGAYPRALGVGGKNLKLPESLVMMQDLFREAGYATGAVVANFNIGATFGFDQGFDRFVESWQEGWRKESPLQTFANRPGRVKEFTNATVVTDQALRWLDSLTRDRPYFLWVHYMDPHGPYVPPPEYGDFFRGAHPPEPFDLQKILRYQRQSENGTPIADLAHYKTQYDREIRYLDGEVGRLLDRVEAQAPKRPLLVALTADHGESLGEHDYYLGHGWFPYQPSARVPAILAMQGELPAGRVVPEPIGLIDFGKTVLRLAGVEPPASFQGRVLTELIHGDPSGAPPYVFMESGSDTVKPQRTVRSGRWKLIAVSAEDDRARMTGAAVELYDLDADPGELDDVAARHPEVVARLGAVLAEWLRHGASAEPGTPVDLESLGPEERQMLRDLGYLE